MNHGMKKHLDDLEHRMRAMPCQTDRSKVTIDIRRLTEEQRRDRLQGLIRGRRNPEWLTTLRPDTLTAIHKQLADRGKSEGPPT